MSCATNRLGDPASMGALLTIALPLMVSQACDTLMIFIDRQFLSQLGPHYMSAAMVGGLSAFMFITFFVGLIGYTNALVAQYLGAGQVNKCGLAVTQSLIIAVAAYPIVLACIPIGYKLFDLFNLPAEQIAPQRTYFVILMFGSVFSLLRHTFSSFFSGIGRTRIVMASTAISLLVNVVCAYLLIFGKLGFPALGIAGAAIGSIVATITGLAILLIAYFHHQQREQFGTVSNMRFNRKVMKNLCKFGSPAGFEFLLNLSAFNLLVMTFHSQGAHVAAAATVAFSWDMVSFIPMIGVNIAVTSLVGRSMGANNPDDAQRVVKSGLKIVSVYAAILLFLCSLFPDALTKVFLSPSETNAYSLSVFLVRLISVYILADAIGLVFSGALRGAGDTFVTMCISVSGHWLLLLVTFVLFNVFNTTPKTTWIALVILIWIIASSLYLRYRSGKWRLLRVIEAQHSAGNVIA
ncbi:MAG: MATE family efflux transporter [Deltaproteobacteria bacterium]|nr:MATE family efflux transporter [Deltaproteobacteria bacterium]